MSIPSYIISSLIILLWSTNSFAQNAKEAAQNRQQIVTGKMTLDRDIQELQAAKTALAHSPKSLVAIFKREIQQNTNKLQQARIEVRQSSAEVRSESREIRQDRTEVRRTPIDNRKDARDLRNDRQDRRDDVRDRQDDVKDYQQRQALLNKQKELLVNYQASANPKVAEHFLATMKREIGMTKVELGEDLGERKEDARERVEDRRERREPVR
ncbi:MAG: hypothetical protein AB8E82_03575 [Aureispira sp.]